MLMQKQYLALLDHDSKNFEAIRYAHFLQYNVKDYVCRILLSTSC